MAKSRAALEVSTMEDRDQDVRAVVDRLDPRRVDCLDRSKSFGEITSTNGAWNGAHYSQKDRFGIERFYDSDGQRVQIEGELPDGTRAQPPKGSKPRRVALPPRQEVDQDGEAEREPGDPMWVDDVNLTAWMLRTERYAWSAVRKAIETRYAKICINDTEAFDFLRQQKLVTDEQLRAAGVKLINDV